jgi:hypothetical protein
MQDVSDIDIPGKDEWLTQPHYFATEIIPRSYQKKSHGAQPAGIWAFGFIVLERGGYNIARNFIP